MSSTSSPNGANGILTPEAMDRMLQHATYGVQMLGAALRHTQSGSSVSVSQSGPGGTGHNGSLGASGTSTNSLAMANTMPPAAPPSTASSSSSVGSNYQHGHTSNAHAPHSNSTSPKLDTKEDMRMIEDAPAPARGVKLENAPAKPVKDSTNGPAGTGASTNDRVKRQVCEPPYVTVYYALPRWLFLVWLLRLLACHVGRGICGVCFI